MEERLNERLSGRLWKIESLSALLVVYGEDSLVYGEDSLVYAEYSVRVPSTSLLKIGSLANQLIYGESLAHQVVHGEGSPQTNWVASYSPFHRRDSLRMVLSARLWRFPYL